jgi:uncharacterized membrane protein (DUF373 family)
MAAPGKILATSGLVALVGWMIFTAWGWPFRAALFPLAVGLPLLALVVVELFLTVTGKSRGIEEESLGADFRLSETSDHALTERRTVIIAVWILSFLLMILLVGFPIAVPLFFFLYLRLGAKESWAATIGTTAVAAASFYALFVWLLRTPLHEGWIQRLLKM